MWGKEETATAEVGLSETDGKTRFKSTVESETELRLSVMRSLLKHHSWQQKILRSPMSSTHS